MSYYVIPEIENALILFVSYPEPGKVGLSMVSELGEKRAAEAYENRFWAQVEEVKSASGVSPYIFYDPPELMDEIEEWLAPLDESFALAAQLGDSMGERLQTAFKRIFSRNTIRKAIFLGPARVAVSASAIADAFAQLDTHDVLVGPTADGSCYLFGLKRLDLQLLQDVKWDGADVMKSIVELASERQLAWAVLPVISPS